MCLIVDTNCLSLTFSDPPHDDLRPIAEALFKGNAQLTIGGTKLRKEYRKHSDAIRALALLDRNGQTKYVNDTEVDKQELKLIEQNVCQSDDQHIVALAQISGTRLVCTKDQNLHADITNKGLLDKPRGSVYQNAGHSELLRRFCLKR